AMLATALKLNPLNIEAQSVNYDLTAESATPLDRVKMLLMQMHANPAQPYVAWQVAKQLGQLGLAEHARDWYIKAGNIFPKSGRAVPTDLVSEFAAQLYISDDPKDTATLLDRLIQADGINAEGWFLRMIVG